MMAETRTDLQQEENPVHHHSSTESELEMKRGDDERSNKRRKGSTPTAWDIEYQRIADITEYFQHLADVSEGKDLSRYGQQQESPSSSTFPGRSSGRDEKYYERRRRNNLAAKKSRDARKLREDLIAARVSHLEQENGILRAQVAMLREESTVLQVYLIQKNQLTSAVSGTGVKLPSSVSRLASTNKKAKSHTTPQT